MILFSRNSRSMIANWWWTVDKILLCLILALVFVGIFLTCSASPAVANRIGIDSFHFVKKQAVFIPLALAVMFFISMQNLKFIRRTAILGYILTIVLTVATLIWGQEIKGATRWIRILGFPLQPSEFLKPTFIVVAAWLFDGHKRFQDFPGNLLSVLLFLFTAGLLISQPDFGMTFVISVIWGFQFFLAGLPLWLVGILMLGGLAGIIGAYCFLPHVQIRIQQFLASDGQLSYQVKKSLEAFQSGHLFGRGPGEGVVKMNIPDAHTDFIFAVAAEEYGLFLCLIIIGIYATIVIRSMIISSRDNNLFIILSAAGLSASFGLQGIINMASALHLMPTKGMTLPFISYGGSSLMATALGIGMLLAITRKNVHAEDQDEND